MTQDDCLQKFWETQEIPFSPKTTWTKQEQECSTHYDETTTRQGDGRFEVEKPFKKPTPALVTRSNTPDSVSKQKKGDCRETLT